MVHALGVHLAIKHPFRAGLAAARVRALRPAGAIALLCAGVAVAALAPASAAAGPEELQWQALAIAPLSAGAHTGLRMVATQLVEPIEFAPDRPTVELAMTYGAGDTLRALITRAGASESEAAQAAAMIVAATPPIAAGTSVSVILGARNGARREIERVMLRSTIAMSLEVARDADGALQLIRHPVPVDNRPLRVRGRAGDGLYWSLRAVGVSPQSAAEYLQALATEIDVGSEISPDDRFDLVIASRRAATGERQTGPLLYAAVDRAAASDLQLVRWGSAGRLSWVDAAEIGRPTAAAMMWPVASRITSGFGYR